MKLATTLGAVVLAATTLTVMPANAMPLPVAGMTADNAGLPLTRIGYRRQHDGITYVSNYGLQYAPNYYFHRHRGEDVYVKIIIKPETDATPRRHTRPLIIDLK